MRKTEIVVLGILLLGYLFKILGISLVFIPINLLVVLVLAIGGFKLFRDPEHTNQTKAKIFAAICGLAFASGVLAIGLRVLNYTTLPLVVALFNGFLFLFLLFEFYKGRKFNYSLYSRGLLIRSGLLAGLFLLVALTPFYLINVYVNKDHEILHNRGLAEFHYKTSVKLTNQERYEAGLDYAHKALDSYRIGWENDSAIYYQAYKAMYYAYLGLIKQGLESGNNDNVLEYSRLILRPTQIWFGDSSRQEAYIKLIAANIFSNYQQYENSDSLFVSSLIIYEHAIGRNNVHYTTALRLAANSYRDQYFYQDAKDLYELGVSLLEQDSTVYTSSDFPDGSEVILEKIKAKMYAEMGWNYSLMMQYDSADLFFFKAFNTEKFIDDTEYPTAITRSAYNTFNRGDYRQAKSLMEEAAQLSFDRYGEEHYDYLFALEGLISVNISLANYKEAEQGCQKALKLTREITDERDENYGAFLYLFGQIKYAQGSYDSAAILFNQALDVTDKVYYQYGEILESLSSLNGDFGKYSIANSQSEQVIQLALEWFPNEDSPYLAKFFRNDAHIKYLMGRLAQAEERYQQSMIIDETNGTIQEVSYANNLNGLGLVKMEQKLLSQADSLFNRSVKIIMHKLGNKHPSYATVLYNKAYLGIRRNKLGKAKELFDQSQSIITPVLGSQHDKVADNYTGLGEIKLKNKEFEEALLFFEKANAIYNDKFDENHRKVKLTNDHINFCVKSMAKQTSRKRASN